MKDNEIISSKIKEVQDAIVIMQTHIIALNNCKERLRKIEGTQLPYLAYLLSADGKSTKIQVKDFKVTSYSISCNYISTSPCDNTYYEIDLSRIALTDEELKIYHINFKNNKLLSIKKEIEKQEQKFQEIKMVIENSKNEESILEKELEELNLNNDIF
jgi:hypothetical protein